MKRIKKERKEINKELGNLKGVLKITLCLLLKAIYTLIKNLIYIGYVLIYNFDNFMAKLFNKLPRILRVSAIYGLIIINVVYFIGLNKKSLKMAKNDKIESVEEVAMVMDEEKEMEELEKVEKVEPKKEVKKEVKKVEQKESCNMEKEIECKIYNKGIEYGMTHEQALLAISISKSETGHWTSNLYVNKNNFGGVTKNGKMASYSTNEEGLDAFVSLLKRRYFDQGLTTPEKIQPVYCPIGAKNDPNGINKNWLPVVSQFWKEYKAKYKNVK